MKELKVKLLVGPAECNDKNIPSFSKEFLEKLSQEMGMTVLQAEMDEVAAQPLPIYFIGSGGAEPGFKANYEKTKEPYILIAHSYYNSFAASMEIMGFLQDHNLKGEIVFGDFKAIASRIKVLLAVSEAKEKLKKSRLGCFGPAGGLIASDVDFDVLKSKTGCEMVLYDLKELVDEYNKGGYPENKYTEELKKKGYDAGEVEKALNVYGALKRLIDKYKLDGVTVKCFDLLSAIHTTGCLALAILNAEGIPAACEGDQKSLLSMYVMRLLTGQSGFMVNPSGLDPKTNEIVFSHCTLPIDMPDTYSLTTHFESGIGVAITCDIASQPMTIFKCNADLTKHYVEKADLIETMHRKDLCRSQMKLKLSKGNDYYLKNPISNHHIICKGDYTEVIDAFFETFKA